MRLDDNDPSVVLYKWAAHKNALREAVNTIKHKNSPIPLSCHNDALVDLIAGVLPSLAIGIKVHEELKFYYTQPFVEIIDELNHAKAVIERARANVTGYFVNKGNQLHHYFISFSLNGCIDADPLQEMIGSSRQLASLLSLDGMDAVVSFEGLPYPSGFVAAYGVAAQKVHDYRPASLESKYQKAGSPAQVQAIQTRFKLRLDELVDKGIADLKEATSHMKGLITHKDFTFAKRTLTPELCALYAEMSKVSSSGMAYFELKDQLNASLALFESSGDESQYEAASMLLEQNPEIRSMRFMQKVIEGYDKAYASMQSRQSLIAQPRFEKVEYTPVAVAALDAAPGKATEEIPVPPVLSVSEQAEQPSVPLLTPSTIPSLTSSSSSPSASSSDSLPPSSSLPSPASSLPSSSSISSPPSPLLSSPSLFPSSSYISPDADVPAENETLLFDIRKDVSLRDISEPKDDALREMYLLVHGINADGSMRLSTPRLLASRLGRFDVALPGAYSRQDMAFLNDVRSYLLDPQNQLYERIRCGDGVKAYVSPLLEKIESVFNNASSNPS